ncbi:dolichyl-diphosphooligosaccharide--protein glycosyltransferase subunit 4-like [Ambystoma mexicanum]
MVSQTPLAIFANMLKVSLFLHYCVAVNSPRKLE